MTKLIFNRDEELAKWAEKTYPDCAPLARPLTAIGIQTSDGEALGVAIYSNFRQDDIHITLVTRDPRWATPGNIRAILHYPFIQLGVKRMTALTAKTNKKARKLLEGVGFHLEGVHPYALCGKTACSYGMYAGDAKRWVNNG